MNRILQVVDNITYGGIQSFIMNVYRQIDRKQIQFDFLVHHYYEDSFESEIKNLGGNVFYVPSRREGYLKNKRAIKNFFAKHPEYKVVHMHESSLSYIEPLIAAKRVGVEKRIIHSHSTTQKGNPLHTVLHLYNKRRIFKIATDMYACSDKAARWFCTEKDYQNNRYTFIPNSIQPEKYYFSEDSRRLIRNEFHIGSETTLYGLIGRLTWQKNHVFLLTLFAEIIKNKPTAKLMLVGDGTDRETLIDKVKELNIQDSVIFTGSRRDAWRFYSALDILVMPSINEGFPVTLVEAQAASLPCLVSENVTKMAMMSDFIEYISLDECMYKWITALDRLLSNHKRKNESELFVNSQFDIKYFAQKLTEMYLE